MSSVLPLPLLAPSYQQQVGLRRLTMTRSKDPLVRLCSEFGNSLCVSCLRHRRCYLRSSSFCLHFEEELVFPGDLLGQGRHLLLRLLRLEDQLLYSSLLSRLPPQLGAFVRAFGAKSRACGLRRVRVFAGLPDRVFGVVADVAPGSPRTVLFVSPPLL